MSDWYRVADDGRITLTLHIQPGAKKTEFAGLHGEALIRFIADTLALPKSAVCLKSGQTSRRKVVEVAGARPEIVAGLAG